MPDHEVLPAFPQSVIPHVGTYRRVLPISLERMYENTLDWEHLPYVHAGSFQAIECQEAGAWGWRAAVVSSRGDRSVIELRLDRACRRWITRTLEGSNAGAEIWTHAFPVEKRRVDIVVDFFVPGVPTGARDKVGAAYASLYRQLYDEDVGMMVERQQQLDQRVGPAAHGEQELDLGPRDDLDLPVEVAFGGRSYVLASEGEDLLVYPALCPHQLGPLRASAPEQGVVTCPWHGYRFDVRSGECVSGHSCRLPSPPAVERRGERVILRAPG